MPNLQAKSDEYLAVQIAEKNSHAFSVLYDRYARRMVNYFYRMLGNDEEKAQDFLQELFLKLWQKAELFDENERFTTWLYTIAHNMCRNEYRRIQVRINSPINADLAKTEHALDESTNTDLCLDSRIVEKAIDGELAKLDEKHRSTFLLRFQAGLSISDISEVLACSQGTVKSRLHYTVKDLSFKLKEYNPY